MKKITYYMILLLPCLMFGQGTSREEMAVSIEKAKSGNVKDVMAGFYQLMFKTLGEDEKALEFNSTLFGALKNLDYVDLNSMNRAKIVFLRNTQLGAKLNLDDEFSYQGYAFELKVALVNKRDTEFINLNGTQADVLHKALTPVLAKTILNMMGNGYNAQQIQEVITGLLRQEDVSKLTLGPMVVADLDNEVNIANIIDTKGNKLATVDAVITAIHDSRNQIIKSRQAKPLWTVGTKGSTNKESKFDRVDFESIFLKGNKDNWVELDLRAKFSYADTAEVSVPRTSFNAKAGVNFKVKNSREQSIFETKIYGEFNAILKNALPDEEKNTVLANADLRLKLFDDLWLPLTIKYDVENANVLGFLNLTFNFGDGD